MVDKRWLTDDEVFQLLGWKNHRNSWYWIARRAIETSTAKGCFRDYPKPSTRADDDPEEPE